MDDSIDFTQLSWEEFELLVELLLLNSGYRIEHRAKPGYRGPDFEAMTSDGQRIIVEVKHFQRPPRGGALIRAFADEVQRLRQQYPDAQGLIVLSTDPPATASGDVLRYEGLSFWTRSTLLQLLSRTPNIWEQFRQLLEAREHLKRRASEFQKAVPGPLQAAVERLRLIPAGLARWRDYERLGTNVLRDIFGAALGAPQIQNRSEDGLDIMDAIFPIRATTPPWSLVRSEYQTRFAVAEFKNYSEAIGQKEVEALAQYLWPVAKRMFGILVTRRTPSVSAFRQRRRAWLENSKMIVFLTDDDLVEMVQVKEASAEPFDVVDAQLEQFLRTLSP